MHDLWMGASESELAKLEQQFAAHENSVLESHNLECYQATSSQLAFSNRLSPLYRPWRDELALARGATRPSWPNGAPFAVCLTHDVDNVSASNARMHLRRAIGAARDLKK